ncbi:hypothetical protein I79_013377 [Cricetulus griseus]|uniref:Uncharacterized protein n=1 Tax=Cricetulus griseus TaxID=10029 RepID=G3HRB2_CRIGR|nr:hypothetical protein I79_013377 [Cricetulus griseus]
MLPPQFNVGNEINTCEGLMELNKLKQMLSTPNITCNFQIWNNRTRHKLHLKKKREIHPYR